MTLFELCNMDEKLMKLFGYDIDEDTKNQEAKLMKQKTEFGNDIYELWNGGYHVPSKNEHPYCFCLEEAKG